MSPLGHRPPPPDPGRPGFDPAPATMLVLELPDGWEVGLEPGAAVGLLGPGSSALLERFAAQPGVAVLLPDTEAPLHPGYRVGEQIAAAVPGTRRAAIDTAIDLLERVGVSEPHLRAGARPHELNRLDRQRVQLALALANGPAGLAAFDPTAGLDPGDAGAWLAGLVRMRARLSLTVVLQADPAVAGRLVDELWFLREDGDVRRVATARGAQAGSSSST